MLLTLHDRSLNIIAYLDNAIPKAIHYYNDNWRRLLKEATSTFSFSIDKIGLDLEKDINEQNYISFSYNNRGYLFSIMKVEEEENSINVYAENLNLELLHETKAPIDITTSQNIVWYLNNAKIIKGASLVIGINEVSDQVRKIKLESEQTALARLLSIVNAFGAEIEFITELNPDGKLKQVTLNILKKYDGDSSQGVGTVRQDVILNYGKNIEGITRTTDKTELFTQITPVGKDGIGIIGLDKTEYDRDGRIEYFSPKSLSSIYAPISADMYPSQLINDDDRYINHEYSADGTSNPETLYSLALNELKKYAYPAITYEVTGFFDLDIGDTVRIVDDGFTPTMTIQARVAEQSICFSDPTQSKTIFGNILALESRVSQDLTGRLKELVDQVTPYRFEIVSDNGLTFKNNEGSTTLTARVFKGSNIEEASVDSFEWLIDGVKFGGTAKSQLINASKVTGAAVVRYNAKLGNTVIGGIEVTLQYVSDGTDGISPINLVIESSNGYQFKNNVINTTFTAILYQNNKEIDSDGTKYAYVWSKTKSDGTVDTAWNLAHQSSQKSITITNSDVWQRATFDCTAEPLS